MVDKKQNNSQQSSIDDFVTEPKLNYFIVYTDGSCIPNPGSGGWAYEIRNSMDVIIDSSSGFDKNTTNNRMELTAVIKSLQSDYIKSNSVVTIRSDSQLIIHTMNKNWKKKENTDLWNDLDKILDHTFTHSRDLGNFPITAVAVDSGGHYTDHVISYCDARKHKRFWAIKGSSAGSGVPIWPVRASQNKRLKKPLYVIGVNDAKETLMQRLRIENKGAGYWHFPIERDQEWFNQITSEVVKTKYVKGRPVRSWEPRKEGTPTEGLDCRVYAFAALRGLVRNWKLDLNKLAEKLSNFPIRNSDSQIQSQKSSSRTKIRRTRSRGID